MSAIFLLGLALTSPGAIAGEDEDAINRCLKAWGTHPFGNHPTYKTLGATVKLFGIGQNTQDTTATEMPELVLVNPGVNIMGGSTIKLSNPNGWYCLQANVNVMGGVTIQAHCKAHIASATDAVTVLGSNASDKGITVMGKTRVELDGCK